MFAEKFKVGVALEVDALNLNDWQLQKFISKHFNSLTAENSQKWEEIHPEPNVYHFGPADRYVAFGEKHGMFLVGHTLVWHHQIPSWVFEDESGKTISREALIGRMRDHIHAVVGRYKGRVQAWDVVNEAIDNDGSMRETPWQKIIGDEYVKLAFQLLLGRMIR